jgi:hypothetical protein
VALSVGGSGPLAGGSPLALRLHDPLLFEPSINSSPDLFTLEDAVSFLDCLEPLGLFIVNPKRIFTARRHEYSNVYTLECHVNIEFDVAVTVSESLESKEKVGVLSVVSLGGGIAHEMTSVSRIKFSIPVLFPTTLSHVGARRSNFKVPSSDPPRGVLA